MDKFHQIINSSLHLEFQVLHRSVAPVAPSGDPFVRHRSATELQRDAQQVQLLSDVEAVGVAHGGGHDEVATMLQRGLVQTFTWGWWGWWENSSGIFRKSMMWKK